MRQQIQAEGLQRLPAACLSTGLLYVMHMHRPDLHESFSQSSNGNLKTSLGSPAHRYLPPGSSPGRSGFLLNFP